MSADDSDSTLLVVNDSDFVIEDLFLTEVDNPNWGSDLLGSDALFPDEEIVLGVDCDFYDVLVVDETGLECEINDIDLCFNDATWVITNNTCDVFSAAAAANEEAPAR